MKLFSVKCKNCGCETSQAVCHICGLPPTVVRTRKMKPLPVQPPQRVCIYTIQVPDEKGRLIWKTVKSRPGDPHWPKEFNE